MRYRYFIPLLAVVMFAAWWISPGRGYAGDAVPSCNGEGGAEFYPCAWDGRHEGNSHGRSYVLNRQGDAIRIPHYYAHRLRQAG